MGLDVAYVLARHILVMEFVLVYHPGSSLLSRYSSVQRAFTRYPRFALLPVLCIVRLIY